MTNKMRKPFIILMLSFCVAANILSAADAHNDSAEQLKEAFLKNQQEKLEYAQANLCSWISLSGEREK